MGYRWRRTHVLSGARCKRSLLADRDRAFLRARARAVDRISVEAWRCGEYVPRLCARNCSGRAWSGVEPRHHRSNIYRAAAANHHRHRHEGSKHPAPGEQAQTFETVEKIEARAEWNAIRPRLVQPQLLSKTMGSIVVQGTAR